MAGYTVRRTKIICTIGPASESEKVIRRMIRGGMDVARLNFSHGSFSSHKRIITLVRQAARQLGKPVAILKDLPGRKLCNGYMEGDRDRLVAGKPIILIY